MPGGHDRASPSGASQESGRHAPLSGLAGAPGSGDARHHVGGEHIHPRHRPLHLAREDVESVGAGNGLRRSAVDLGQFEAPKPVAGAVLSRITSYSSLGGYVGGTGPMEEACQ